MNIFGLIIFSLGLVILAGFGFYEFFKDAEISQLVKWGIGVVILGLIILLISLIFERLKDREKEL